MKRQEDMRVVNSQSGLSVLVVDDELAIRNLLLASMVEYGHTCLAASDVPQALAMLESNRFDVVISDLNMPGKSGLDLWTHLAMRHPEVPLVFLTAEDDLRLAVSTIRSGASDYLVKPFRPQHVIASIQRAVEEKRLCHQPEQLRRSLEARITQQAHELKKALRQVSAACESTMHALGSALELRDSETEEHCRRVSHMSQVIAQKLRIEEGVLQAIAYGAYLHDIGKIGIPDAILLKAGPLTAEEQAIMRTHVQIGYQMIRAIPFLQGAAEIILTHHEAFNGSGYPRGLKGEEIPLGSRIFALADTADAITSSRPYRAARPFGDARQEIIRCSGTQFDPKVVAVFLSLSPHELLRS